MKVYLGKSNEKPNQLRNTENSMMPRGTRHSRYKNKKQSYRVDVDKRTSLRGKTNVDLLCP